MAIRNVILAVPLIRFDAADLASNYFAMNPEGLDESCFLIVISNDSSCAVIVSFDGISDHQYLQPKQVLKINGNLESATIKNICRFKKGTILYIKSEMSGNGNIYVSGYYQPTK